MLNIHLDLPSGPEAVAQYPSAMLSSHSSGYLIFSNKDQDLFSTSEAKTTISIQRDCHIVGPVHKWQMRRDSGTLPRSCKHRQRVFHGDKLRQMVEALLHGRDCQWILSGLTELGSAAGTTDHHWLTSRICSVCVSFHGGSC